MKVRPLTNENPVSVASSHCVKLRRSGGFAAMPLGGAVTLGSAATLVSPFAMLLPPSKVASAKGSDDLNYELYRSRSEPDKPFTHAAGSPIENAFARL